MGLTANSVSQMSPQRGSLGSRPAEYVLHFTPISYTFTTHKADSRKFLCPASFVRLDFVGCVAAGEDSGVGDANDARDEINRVLFVCLFSHQDTVQNDIIKNAV